MMLSNASGHLVASAGVDWHGGQSSALRGRGCRLYPDPCVVLSTHTNCIFVVDAGCKATHGSHQPGADWVPGTSIMVATGKTQRMGVQPGLVHLFVRSAAYRPCFACRSRC